MVAIRGGVQWLAEAAWGVQRRHAEVACRGGGSMYQRRSAASRGSVQERRSGCTPQWVGVSVEKLRMEDENWLDIPFEAAVTT